MLENGIDPLSVMKMTGLTDDEIQRSGGEMENIQRRFQRWKVIMIPGGKSYESWDEMVTGEDFPEEARQTYKTHRTKAIDRTLKQPDYVHTMSESGVTVRYKLERWR